MLDQVALAHALLAGMRHQAAHHIQLVITREEQRALGQRRLAAAVQAHEVLDNVGHVAAPLRDASKQIVAGISVASTVPYMPLEKMAELVPLIKQIAAELSADLGG